ncbi:MAG TPA: hypothetical protein PLW10_25525, partial [Myxococcota bacterium]|nr:hypothetical protein [Myxococcota bacterium]
GMRTRSNRWNAFGLVILVVGSLAAWIGCSDPDRAILERLSAVERARFQRGRQVATPCWTCHDLAGRVQKVGPSLLGVYGRPSGTAPGSHEGSPALRAASIVWDDRSLAAFLSDPQGFVPGNRMVSPGVGDGAALSDLLFYLRHVTRPGAREPGGSPPREAR